MTVELDRHDNTEAAQTLVDLLGKDNVCSGKAIQNAASRQILETLPGVWNRLVSEPNCPIFNLLAERTQRLRIRKPGI